MTNPAGTDPNANPNPTDVPPGDVPPSGDVPPNSDPNTPPVDPPTDPPGGDPAPNEFLTSLGEELGAHEALKDVKDPQSLAKLYVESTEKLAAVPTAPDTPADYTLPEVPEGITLNDEALNAWRDAAHKIGLPDEAFKAGTSIQLQMISDAREKVAGENKTMMESLQKEYGSKFDDTIASVNQLVDKLPEFKAMLDQGDPSGEASLMRTNPHVFRALATFASIVSIDTIQPGAGPGTGGRQRTSDGRPMLSYPSMGDK